VENKNIADRMRMIIDACISGRSKFSQLEKITNLPEDAWKSFYYSKQRPNQDMIESLCKTWPQYAFWLGTGATDSGNGHISPTGEVNDLKRETQVTFRIA
jgi:hypothetical protein